MVDGRYEIVRPLGRGGFATVYLARHVHMGRSAALKVLDAERSREDPSYAERFLREARIASSIRHPHVVTLYDFGFDAEHRPYIAMELLDGHDLADELRHNGPLSPARALRLFKPVLEALGVGHRSGIVHKDLKPANLYLRAPGTASEALLVLDFGVARSTDPNVSNLTETGQLLGTPRYLAPEYIKTQTVTPAIDVYQMALIFSEVLCGKPAVDGPAFTVVMQHCSGQLLVPPVLLDGEVGRVMRRALAVDHRERYADCSAFLEALTSVEAAFLALPAVIVPPSADALGTGSFERAPDTTPAPFGVGPITGNQAQPFPVSASGPIAASPGAAPRSRLLLGLTALLGVLLLTLALVLALAGGGDDEELAEAEAAPEPSPETAAPLAAETATMVFVSEPLGASVIIDGVERGRTPFSLALPLGETLSVETRLTGYLPHRAEVTPAADAQPLVATLEAEPSVVAQPPAPEPAAAEPPSTEPAAAPDEPADESASAARTTPTKSGDSERKSEAARASEADKPSRKSSASAEDEKKPRKYRVAP